MNKSKEQAYQTNIALYYTVLKNQSFGYIEVNALEVK